MPQMHFSIDHETARELENMARSSGQSLSRYLADLVKTAQSPGTWPAGYLEAVVGSCAGDPLSEPLELPVDDVPL